MWSALGAPGQPSGQSANAQWSSGTASPRGMSGELGFGESLGNTYSSACACALSLDTAGEGFNAGAPDSGSGKGLPPLKVRAEKPGRMRSLTSPPFFLRAIGEFTLRRVLPGARSPPP